MLIVTSNGIPGYRIEAVLGQVMGMTVRAPNLGSSLTAGFRSRGGGDDPEFTKLVYESRNEAVNRMWGECVRRGGNAIVAMQFDTGEVASATEVCAYGTAVVASPIPEDEPGATPQSIARAAAANPGPGNWPRMEGQQLPDEGAPPWGEGQRRQAPASSPTQPDQSAEAPRAPEGAPGQPDPSQRDGL